METDQSAVRKMLFCQHSVEKTKCANSMRSVSAELANNNDRH